MLTGFRLYAGLAAAGVILSAIGGAYWKGRADCGAKQRRLQQEAAAAWNDRVGYAQTDVLAGLLADSKREAEERQALNDIVKDTPETGICVPADTVERLRKLQAN